MLKNQEHGHRRRRGLARTIRDVTEELGIADDKALTEELRLRLEAKQHNHPTDEPHLGAVGLFLI